MDDTETMAAMAALANPARVEILRRLTAAPADGLAAGAIGGMLKLQSSTLSNHLAILTRAGLVTRERQARSIIYRADLQQLAELTKYLIEDCLAGHPDICRPIEASFRQAPTPNEGVLT